jgi:hypothetical protein
VFWEHHFSDYRENDGLKLWRKLEVQIDGKKFAVLDVTDVVYSDEPLPELRSVRDRP